MKLLVCLLAVIVAALAAPVEEAAPIIKEEEPLIKVDDSLIKEDESHIEAPADKDAPPLLQEDIPLEKDTAPLEKEDLPIDEDLRPLILDDKPEVHLEDPAAGIHEIIKEPIPSDLEEPEPTDMTLFILYAGFADPEPDILMTILKEGNLD